MIPAVPTGQTLAAAAPLRVPRRGRGFTIVELMLAVVAVGVLSALATSGYGHYRDKVNVHTAVQDIAVLSLLIRAACADDRQCPATLPSNKLDPWGNPYRYLALDSGSRTSMSAARKDRSLVPINSDFDLYSMGPDGKSTAPLTALSSRDDIVRARDGAFIGVASDF